MTLGVDEPIALGPYRISLATTRVLRDGVDLELRPRAFRALKVLIQNPGRLVDYEQMIREAWDGVQVSHHTVTVTVGEIKNMLRECGSWIVCRPKFGYTLQVPKSDDFIRRGWHFWSQYTRAGFEHALHCFHQAADVDSADFRAFEGISSTYLMLAGFLMRAPRDIHGPFLEALERAVALRGLTPELRLDRAFALFVFERRIAEAESELLAIQPERPKSALLYVRLALICLAVGRSDEAQAWLRQAEATEALSPDLAFLRLVIQLFARDFAAAVELGENALDLHPASQIGRAFYADALDWAGRTEEAHTQYRLASTLSPDTQWIRADQARCLALHGQVAEACACLADLQRHRENEYVDAYHIALLLDALGKRDEAFEELERAYRENSYALLFAGLDAKADGLRSDPRFASLRRRALSGTYSASAPAAG
jgi:DNA-binding winged helix-turn-helix (wHTH) protein/tetratricopeptide (TPR) repeat protein